MSDAAQIIIFHNPDCGLSRRALEYLQAAGHQPTIVEYLKVGWTKDQLKDLLGRLKVGPRYILRDKEAVAEALGLLDSSASDEAILDAMVQHPVLVNRPIVVTRKGAIMARPAEALLGSTLLE